MQELEKGGRDRKITAFDSVYMTVTFFRAEVVLSQAFQTSFQP